MNEKEKTQHMRAEYLKLEDEKDAWKAQCRMRLASLQLTRLLPK